jgi:hypothetical protein
MNRRQVFFAAAMITIAIAMRPAMAATISLPAVQDSLIRSGGSAANTNYNSDLLMVQGNNHALFQFDLSSLGPNTLITGAHLELYPTAPSNVIHAIQMYLVFPEAGADDLDLVQVGPNRDTSVTVAFDKDGMHQEYVSYNSYSDAVGNSGSWVESSRQASLEFPAGPEVDGTYQGNTIYYAGNSADSGVLDILNEAKDGPGYIIVLAWRNGSASAIFSSIEDGNPPRLVLETSTQVPEPLTYTLLGLGGLGLMVLGRRRAG